MDDSILNDIKFFIEETRWKYPFELKRETRIKQDLKITGIEAYGFIDEFCKRFGIDNSNFNFNSYFKPEGDWILQAIINFLRGKKGEMKILTIGDLEIAIKSKVLI